MVSRGPEGGGGSSIGAFVDRIGTFTTLDDQDIGRFEAACDNIRSVPANYDLVREGGIQDTLFVVLQGLACRYKVMPEGRRQILAFLMPGDFSDPHIGVLDDMDHSIGTLTPSRIAAIPGDRIAMLVESTSAISRAFRRAQLIDGAISRAWIANLGRRNSTERVAHLMCELYIRMSQVGLTNGDRAEMPLTQIMLADALGLTPVHVNRVLQTLRLAGIMDLRRDALFIHEPEKLSRLAGFDDNYLHRRVDRSN